MEYYVTTMLYSKVDPVKSGLTVETCKIPRRSMWREPSLISAKLVQSKTRNDTSLWSLNPPAWQTTRLQPSTSAKPTTCKATVNSSHQILRATINVGHGIETLFVWSDQRIVGTGLYSSMLALYGSVFAFTVRVGTGLRTSSSFFGEKTCIAIMSWLIDLWLILIDFLGLGEGPKIST